MRFKQLELEFWEDIKGYEGLYQVSDQGRVKSMNYNHTGKKAVLSTMYDKDGYLKLNLWNNGDKKNFRVHSLVARAFPDICGEWFEGAEVDHINTIKTDNRAVNLRVCTAKENSNNPITRKHMSEAQKGKTIVQKKGG